MQEHNTPTIESYDAHYGFRMKTGSFSGGAIYYRCFIENHSDTNAIEFVLTVKRMWARFLPFFLFLMLYFLFHSESSKIKGVI